MSSRGEGDAGKRAERPERPRKVGGGTAEDTGAERQAHPARVENTGDETPKLLEEVLRRGNMLKANARVVWNGGAPGVDGMTVHQLWGYCQASWPRIREELLSGRYKPQPVLRVEIPKPGGGVRMLVIPNGHRELHLLTVRRRDGQKSPIPSIRLAGSGFSS